MANDGTAGVQGLDPEPYNEWYLDEQNMWFELVSFMNWYLTWYICCPQVAERSLARMEEDWESQERAKAGIWDQPRWSVYTIIGIHQQMTIGWENLLVDTNYCCWLWLRLLDTLRLSCCYPSIIVVGYDWEQLWVGHFLWWMGKSIGGDTDGIWWMGKSIPSVEMVMVDGETPTIGVKTKGFQHRFSHQPSLWVYL